MRPPSFLAVVPFLLSPLAAQGAAPERALLDALARPDFDARLLVASEGTLHAVGSNYVAKATARSVTFAPSGVGEHDATTRWSLLGVGRGRPDVLPEVLDVRADGVVGELVRAAGVVERYEVRTDGLKQSFLFAERPPGAGDLVVRLGLDTDLRVEASPDGGLALSSGGVTLVRIGDVLGVDAVGEEVPGALVLRDGAVDLVLPAWFVDAATYPLELDPLVSSTTPLGSFVDSLADPDVAYDETFGRWLMVCRLQVLTDSGIVAYRFDEDLNPVGGQVTLAPPAFTGRWDPGVGSVNPTNQFLVAWVEGNLFDPPEVVARSVHAGTGATSALVRLSDPTASAGSPCVSGSASPSVFSGHAWVAFEQPILGVRARRVLVPGSGPLALDPTVTISDANGSNPAISRSGGDGQRHLVVWQQDFGPDHDLEYALLSQFGGVLFPPQSLIATTTQNEVDPSVDGDGSTFLVTWRENDLTPFPTDRLRAHCLGWDGSALSIDVPEFGIVADGPFGTVGEARVAFTGNRFLVANTYASTLSSSVELYLRGYSPDGCLACSAVEALGGAATQKELPAIASRWAGGDWTSDGGLLVWQQPDSNGTTGIRARPVEGVVGGSVVDHGGGCGSGGVLSSDDPHLGHAGYELWIDGAEAGATVAIVNLNGNPILFQCGSCTSNVNVGALEVVGLAGGSGVLPLPIPCDPALLDYTTHAQAIAVLPTTSVPCPQFPTVSITNRLELTIGQ